MMKHEAIYNLYQNVVRVDEGENGFTAYDASENIVSIVMDDVDAKATELLAARNIEDLRKERNIKLSETDHWALSDTATMTQAQTDYRQALRDITNSYTSLDDVVWPTKP